MTAATLGATAAMAAGTPALRQVAGAAVPIVQTHLAIAKRMSAPFGGS
jgi:hypothetical protein